MALALAWKFRWAVIRSTSSAVRSTLERSRAPARMVPKPAAHLARPMLDHQRPEVAVVTGVTYLTQTFGSGEVSQNNFTQRLLRTIGVTGNHQTIIADIYTDQVPFRSTVLCLTQDRRMGC